MIYNKISEDEYEIEIPDMVAMCDDLVCGHVRREPNADSDLAYWHFYPCVKNQPISELSLSKILKMLRELNTGNQSIVDLRL